MDRESRRRHRVSRGSTRSRGEPLYSSRQMASCMRFSRRFAVHLCLNTEVGACLEPIEREVEQLVDGPAPVVAGAGLVQPPPHPLHRVAVGGGGRQVVQDHPLTHAAKYAFTTLLVPGLWKPALSPITWITLEWRNARRRSSRCRPGAWRPQSAQRPRWTVNRRIRGCRGISVWNCSAVPVWMSGPLQCGHASGSGAWRHSAPTRAGAVGGRRRICDRAFWHRDWAALCGTARPGVYRRVWLPRACGSVRRPELRVRRSVSGRPGNRDIPAVHAAYRTQNGREITAHRTRTLNKHEYSLDRVRDKRK